MDRKAVVETIKTALRAVYFAFLGVVVLVLTVVATSPEIAQATVTVPYVNVTLSVGALIVAGAASVAKLIDRYRHKSSNTRSNGIAPSFLQD